MLEEFLERLAADKRSQGNPLVSHLSPFAASLAEDGYADATMQAKLFLLRDFGQWLARRELSVMGLDERLVEKFINNRRQKGRLQRGDGETLRQFLKHLRGRHIAPEPHPIRDGSPLAQILNRYEKHLRSERGVVTSTVVNYLSPLILARTLPEGPLTPSQSEFLRHFSFCFAPCPDHGSPKGPVDGNSVPLLLPLPFSER